MTRSTGRGPSFLAPTLACLALVGVAACSSEADKAAKSLTGILATLGVDGLTYRKSDMPGPGTVALLGATGTFRDRGPVQADEISVRGFQGTPADWSATAIQADNVSGPLKVRRLTASRPSVRAGMATFAGGVRYEDVEASLAGVPLRAADVSVAPVPGPGTAYVATGLRAIDPASLPPVLAPLAATPWDIELVVRDAAPGRVGVELRRARSDAGDLTASLSLIVPEGRDASYLSGMTARDLFDPARWPEGVQLRAFDASGMLTGPPAGMPPEAEVTDEGLRRTIATARASTAPTRWTLSMTPSSPVPMRDLGSLLRREDATATLGLEVSGRAVETIGGGRPGSASR